MKEPIGFLIGIYICFYLLTAYYLNKKYGKKALIKKMGRRLPNVL